MSVPEVLDHVLYHPFEHRSPELLNRNGGEAVAVKVADDDTGRAMLIFTTCTMAAAVPEEMRVL